MKKEKVYNCILFILIFLGIVSNILLRPIENLDELWNYNFARNIANGLIPYRDFNIITTPLLSMVCGLILKLTLDELIIMRILAALLCSIILYLVYKIFNALNVKKEISIVLILFIGYLFKDLFCIDYNFASLLMVLMIIYKEIKYYQKDNKFLKVNIKEDIVLGFLAGLAIVTKQTSGLLICIAALGNKLLFVREKEELKIYLKSFAFRLTGVCIPLIMLLIYLIFNNCFLAFVSYAINGVTEFTNVITYKNLIKWDMVGVLSILVPITFVYAWIKSIILNKDKKIYILLVYGLAIFVICFPITDKIHFLIGSLPVIILMLSETYNLLRKIYNKIFNDEKLNKLFLVFVITFTILNLIYYIWVNFSNYLKDAHYSILNHYKYIPISVELESQIRSVNDYINSINTDIKILDASAAVYMISNDRYNKDYDMLNKGNLGENGEERIINEIEDSINTKYLILNDEFIKNWQTPLNVINYVKEKKEKIGEISIFDIYE